MRMCRKRALSFLLTLVLIAGCFAGTGVTAKATGVPYSSNDSITVSVDGSEEGGIVDKTKLITQIQDAESRNEKDYKADGKWALMQEKLNAAKAVNANE